MSRRAASTRGMPGVKRSEMQATAFPLVQPAARSFSSTATWKFATVSWDLSASVSCSEYGQRALTPAAEANGAELVSFEVGTAELGPAEYVATDPQIEVIELLIDAAELITGTAEVRTGDAGLMPEAAELMTRAAELMTGAAARMPGPAERMTGAAEQMAGAAERMIGAAELMTGAAARMPGPAEQMTGAAERMAGAAERMAGAAERMTGAARLMTGAEKRMTGAAGLMTGVPLAGLTIAELAAEFLTVCRDTRFTAIFFWGSRLKGYTVTHVIKKESYKLERNKLNIHVGTVLL
jgi:hypothetical protein